MWHTLYEQEMYATGLGGLVQYTGVNQRGNSEPWLRKI